MKTLCTLIAFTIVATDFVTGQWTQTAGSAATPTYSLSVSNSNVFVGGQSKLFVSDNTGNGWTDIGNGGLLINNGVTAVHAEGSTVFAGFASGGIRRTTNSGTNWYEINSGLINLTGRFHRFVSAGSYLFAASEGAGVYRSSDAGDSWTFLSSTFPRQLVWPIAHNGANLFAGTQGDGIFRSTDNGDSWSPVNSGLSNLYLMSLAAKGSDMYAGSYAVAWGGPGGIFRSTDNGDTWILVKSEPADTEVRAIVTSGQKIFAGLRGGGVYLSEDDGATWIPVNSGLTNLSVLDLAVSNTHLFVAAQSGGLWSRPLSEMVTSADKLEDPLPVLYLLEQNYPNPFNPSTQIRYSLPTPSKVRLTVHDLLGREVAVLVDEIQPAGYREAVWDASSFASGVYLYRLATGTIVQSRKMIVVK